MCNEVCANTLVGLRRVEVPAGKSIYSKGLFFVLVFGHEEPDHLARVATVGWQTQTKSAPATKLEPVADAFGGRAAPMPQWAFWDPTIQGYPFWGH